MKTRPQEAAKQIASNIDASSSSLIGSCEAHSDGFINFKANFTELAYGTLSDAIAKGDYGSINLGEGKKILVEHTSVNPNKALHVGHLRNLVIGDAVARILRFTGHDVKILNYIDDSGLQVADLIVGFRKLNLPIDPPKPMKYDQYCGDEIYIKVNQAYESNPALQEERRKILQEMEEQGSETASLAREVTLRVLKSQLITCWRTGAHYDLLNFESHILETKLWDNVFKELKAKGIATQASTGKYAGCWIVKVEGEEEGEEKVLVRSNGTATYVAKDIPYAAWKIGLIEDPFKYKVFHYEPNGQPLWCTTIQAGEKQHPVFAGADRSITVIDVRQSRLQRIISYILSLLGGPRFKDAYVHLGYAVVNLSAKTAEKLGVKTGEAGQVKMSGRSGIYVNADDVLDALYARSYEETKKRNPEAEDNWLKNVAEKIAVAALRFELLKQDLEKDLTFDMDESIRLEGETGPYLQYSYARACRILDKAAITPSFPRSRAELLGSGEEAELVKHISKFDMYVEEAARSLSPKTVARYSYTLCTLFNIFYESRPVLSAQEEVKMARLALVKAFQTTLRNALGVMGIEALDKI